MNTQAEKISEALLQACEELTVAQKAIFVDYLAGTYRERLCGGLLERDIRFAFRMAKREQI